LSNGFGHAARERAITRMGKEDLLPHYGKLVSAQVFVFEQLG
jgi:hypothetical protein